MPTNELKTLADNLQKLHVLLMRIAKNPKETSLKDFHKHLISSPWPVIKVMKDQLLAMFTSILMDESLTPGVKENAVKCVNVVVCVETINDIAIFRSLYSLICNQIFDPLSCSIASTDAEELNGAVMNCLKDLINHIDNNTLLTVYNSNCTIILSQGILLACQIVQFDKCLKNRVAAFEFIFAVGQHSKDIVPLEQVEEMFIHFIPGLIIACSKIIFDNTTTHHKIVQLAVRAWGHVLKLTLRDLPTSNCEMSDSDLVRSWQHRTIPDETEDPPLIILQKPERTMKWKKVAGKTLSKIIFPSSEMWTHPHPAVRIELVAAHWHLVEACSISLGSHTANALDVLIRLSIDENENVQSMALTALKKLPPVKLHVMIIERLPWIISRLTQVLIPGNEDEVTYYFNLLESYLRIEEGHELSCRFPLNSLHLQKLSRVLVSAATLKKSPDLIVSDSKGGSQELSDWKKYVKLNKMAENAVRSACTLFVKALPALVEYLNNDDSATLSAINLLIESVPSLTPPLADSLLHRYLQYSEDRSFVSLSSPTDKEEKVLKVSLAIEGLGLISSKLHTDQKQDFDKYFLQALYPTMSQMGSNFSILRAAGIKASELMAKAIKVVDVSEMIQMYVGYLTHHIVKDLRKGSSDALAAAMIVTKHCPKQAIPSLQTVVGQILKRSRDESRPELLAPYLGVFLMFVQCVAGGSIEKEMMMPVSKRNISPIQRLISFLEEKKMEKEDINVDENVNIGESNETDGDIEERNEEKPDPPLPVHIKLTIAVLKRCLHCVASRKRDIVLISLDILDAGLPVLRPYENELLPLVHEIWSPLVRRFDAHNDLLIIHQSYNLLTTLAALAKDFIRFRTLKEVLPGLRDALSQLSKDSKGAKMSSAYYATQKYKLQKAVLGGLGPLTCHLNLRERETSWVVEVACPYLSSRQPSELQERAVELFLSLLEHDPFLVGYRLKPLMHSTDFKTNVGKIMAAARNCDS